MSQIEIHAGRRTREALGSSLANRVVSLLRNWRSRRQLRALMELEDNMLRDIGITRGDVIWAMSLPITTNSTAELNQISKRKRRR